MSDHEHEQLEQPTLVQELAAAAGTAPRPEGFDPAAEAAEARESGRDELEQVVGVYGGYLSACWENLSGAGVFESTRARAAAEAMVAWLREWRQTPA